MPGISSLMPRALAALTVMTALASAVSAQQPQTVRIRGTIESVDGAVLTIKARDGAEMKVRTTDNVAVTGVAKIDKGRHQDGVLYRRHRQCRSPMEARRRSRSMSFPKRCAVPVRVSGPGTFVPTSTMTNATVDREGRGQ